MKKSITLAKSAGFCYGVDRAVMLVEDLVKEGRKVCTLGPIIHNEQVVNALKAKGVITVNTVDEIPDGYTVVIRSHGVKKEILQEIQDKNISFCDATCPFVSKIHKIVDNNSSDNSTVFIAGDSEHAEVIGIKSYSKGKTFVLPSYEELEKCEPDSTLNDIILVSQTTFDSQIWKNSKKIVKKLYTNVKIFDTICYATAKRQNEAAALSDVSDLMIVIGDKHSSNTKKLFNICSAKTKTLLIETAEDLDLQAVKSAISIGVTAGASTPAVIIKEVINKMTDIIKDEDTSIEAIETTTEETVAPKMEEETVKQPSIDITDDMSFEEALEASLSSMNTNQKVKGIVVAVNPTEVQVDIGRKYTGVVPADELSNDSTLSTSDIVKVGDEIDLIVMKTNDMEGIITLSKKRFDAFAGYAAMEEAQNANTILEGKVTAVVKGGITVISSGIKVFIPASQATLSKSEDLNDLVSTTVRFRVIDIRKGRNVVGSIRSILREERKAQKEAIWSQIAVGATFTGTVKSLTAYGAFVDIGGVDGMIHITELSWKRIKHPSDVVSIGDVVEVYVKEVDTESQRISLGYKKTEENPWEVIKTKYAEGDVATAKIVSFATYGAFASLLPGIDGLIHISQISYDRIEKPSDVLEIGQEVNVKITEIDFERKRVSLSIKATLEAPAREEKAETEQRFASTEDMEKMVSDFADDISASTEE